MMGSLSMKIAVKASTLDQLMRLEQEMAAQGRTEAAEALRETHNALTNPTRGWLTTGQAAGRLDVSIPTVKDWIRRGTLTGRQVGSRWYVFEDSVGKVLGLRRVLADMDREVQPTEENHELNRRLCRHAGAAERRKVVG